MYRAFVFELLQPPANVRGPRVVRQLVDVHGNADPLAGLDEVAYVGERGIVFAYQHNDEPGMNPRLAKGSTTGEQFGAQFSRNRAAV